MEAVRDVGLVVGGLGAFGIAAWALLPFTNFPAEGGMLEALHLRARRFGGGVCGVGPGSSPGSGVGVSGERRQ